MVLKHFQAVIHRHPSASTAVKPTAENLRRGAACAPGHAGGGEAVPRRALGGVRLGRPPRLQGCSERLRQEPDGKARRHPPPGHYEPGAPIGRYRHPEGRSARRGPAAGPEERWSRRLEAPRPMRPGRENRGDATGRPTLKIHFRRPLLAFYSRPGSASGARARGDSARLVARSGDWRGAALAGDCAPTPEC